MLRSRQGKCQDEKAVEAQLRSCFQHADRRDRVLHYCSKSRGAGFSALWFCLTLAGRGALFASPTVGKNLVNAISTKRIGTTVPLWCATAKATLAAVAEFYPPFARRTFSESGAGRCVPIWCRCGLTSPQLGIKCVRGFSYASEALDVTYTCVCYRSHAGSHGGYGAEDRRWVKQRRNLHSDQRISTRA
jgi:hypothetical protein